MVRTLDANISWSVKGENNYVVFSLLKNNQELGKIIFAGETVTTWTR